MKMQKNFLKQEGYNLISYQKDDYNENLEEIINSLNNILEEEQLEISVKGGEEDERKKAGK